MKFVVFYVKICRVKRCNYGLPDSENGWREVENWIELLKLETASIIKTVTDQHDPPLSWRNRYAQKIKPTAKVLFFGQA